MFGMDRAGSALHLEPTALLPLSPLVGEHAFSFFFFFLNASTFIRIGVLPLSHCKQSGIFLFFTANNRGLCHVRCHDVRQRPIGVPEAVRQNKS